MGKNERIGFTCVRTQTHTHMHTHTPHFSYKDRTPSAYLSISGGAVGREGYWQDPCVRARAGKASPAPRGQKQNQKKMTSPATTTAHLGCTPTFFSPSPITSFLRTPGCLSPSSHSQTRSGLGGKLKVIERESERERERERERGRY